MAKGKIRKEKREKKRVSGADKAPLLGKVPD
jgi:hypothetical protein